MAKGQDAAQAAPAVDFKALLNTPAEEATRPLPLPIGSWESVIKDFSFDKSRKKKTPFVRFNFGLTAPGADVDPSLLDDVKWQGKTLSLDFYITDDAIYRITEFFESLGVTTAGQTLNELIQGAPGLPALLSISQRPSDDVESDAVYTEIDGVAGM